MFSRWIITNITSARGTLHCRKTRIPCGNQLVICGLKSRRRPTFHRCILPPSSDDDNDEVSTSEPSRYLNDTTRHHISEGCYIRYAFFCSQYLRHVLFLWLLQPAMHLGNVTNVRLMCMVYIHKLRAGDVQSCMLLCSMYSLQHYFIWLIVCCRDVIILTCPFPAILAPFPVRTLSRRLALTAGQFRNSEAKSLLFLEVGEQ